MYLVRGTWKVLQDQTINGKLRRGGYVVGKTFNNKLLLPQRRQSQILMPRVFKNHRRVEQHQQKIKDSVSNTLV